MWLERLNTKKLDAEFLLTHPVWDVTTVLNTDSALKAFLLTHPVWDVTNRRRPYKRLNFISTHTSRVGCDSLLPIISVRFSISTHTSRVGCDSVAGSNLSSLGISTHTSRVGCDTVNIVSLSHTIIPTHTSRVGCDNPVMNCLRGYINFYSHIPCGMWPVFRLTSLDIKMISTHTSRVGCDWCLCRFWVVLQISTHTSRVGCDIHSTKKPKCKCISTHTSRVGCDVRRSRNFYGVSHFYSHIPCGMWPTSFCAIIGTTLFLLTHPVWDVTCHVLLCQAE